MIAYNCYYAQTSILWYSFIVKFGIIPCRVSCWLNLKEKKIDGGNDD